MTAQDMTGTSEISCAESCPRLRTFASTGTYPLSLDTSFEGSFQSSGLRRFSCSDVDRGSLRPLSLDENNFRTWSFRACKIGDQAFHMEDGLSLQARPPERKTTAEIRSTTGIAEVSRNKVAKGSPPQSTFERFTPAFPEEKIDSPKRLSFGTDRSKTMGYKKNYERWKTLPLDKFSYAECSRDNPAQLQDLRGHSGPLTGGNECYSVFKTKAPKLERPFSHYSTRNQEEPGQYGISDHESLPPGVQIIMPVGRYFDALKGPELEILRDSEDTLLPVDKTWPFLLRFPIGCFGICLGLGNQTILWKTLSAAASVHFLHVPRTINLILWCLALAALLAVFTIYSLKCIFYFAAVRREFYHPVRINFFFAPWIACMFLTIGIPPAIARSIHPTLSLLFMTPVFLLELKIYGQWLSGGERKLCKVANPSTHLSLVGNFVGALLAATVGWKELATFFWAVGAAHYLVLFVTLYQRLPSAAVIPKELHPVFFLFVAVPSTASVAWSKIAGDFDLVSRIAYFMGLFLYSSLVVRINFFRGFRFSVAWWAYTFPMTASAIATIHYSVKVPHPITQGLAVLLSSISSITVLSMCVLTLLHTFVWRNMFPNDMAIAITTRNSGVKRKIKDPHKYDLSPSRTQSEGLAHSWVLF